MKRFWIVFIAGLLLGILLVLGSNAAVKITSTNDFCASCHIHPQATTSWKQSVHYITRSGDKTGCVECHLPPKGQGHIPAKIKTGLRDLYGQLFKDHDSFDWEDKSRLENARKHVPESSCLHCHETLFTPELSREGEQAHLYYDQTEKTADLHCINCHLNAGHYIDGYTHGGKELLGFQEGKTDTIYEEAARVDSFGSYTEYLPGSSVSFEMIAVSGGEFMMGSPEDEPFRKVDEGPQVNVRVSPFFMGEVEVTWDEYMVFYAQTSAEGRSTDTEGIRSGSSIDAISGATPPYGQPDQNWGMGKRPVISITHHAAETYCRWLSLVTGKKYRLPTEAEWEYACRAGSESPYFFDGNPKDFQRSGILSALRKNDTTNINTFVIYQGNSPTKTQEPSMVKANPFGLKNMPGNVAEFCSDWYSEDTYSMYPATGVSNPSGPPTGEEKVIRGGSFRDRAGRLRSAARDHTRTEQWLRTDPQIPKSKWWYSDCYHVGFRVVCEYDDSTGNTGGANKL
jgi:formylglycine-generating enzyme required for sulfatase activity/nitrate/TMAO reductase-like tetraheme cytochrome c subunit